MPNPVYDYETLFKRLLYSITLCENGGDLIEDVARAIKLADLGDVEIEQLSDAQNFLESIGIDKGIWG
jgi:hypothetical protein